VNAVQVMLLALVVALVVDVWLGEPAPHFHPVVWMGNFLSLFDAWVAPTTSAAATSAADYSSFGRGALIWLLGGGMIWTLFAALQELFLQLPIALSVVLIGLALKPMLAWKMLKDEVLAVETALGQSLDAGRVRLSYLVSRDVTTLTPEQVRESAIETLAENLNDSVVAPLFWYVALGLPGAALYRFANTADAMWGYSGMYRGRYWQWAGKWAARADDVLSWIPARITALLIVFVSFVSGDREGALNRLRAEAHQTPSPNSGWPMAAMALALGVSLNKPTVYCLNAQGSTPRCGDIERSAVLASKVWIVLMASAVGLVVVGCFL
jgi:adenosylcobinamide-phosphate synthase